ncbi:MAG: enoyl-CoA hydratase/isomerase family protein [Desulfobacterales bacterium]|nr:enoyl-CoA hydratase/isomerase family protein [Desulfobacterales bacterium]MBS3756036.1 enoyl-CoA hydratase/isomerase family protein [Desulfobacterales bacterium]
MAEELNLLEIKDQIATITFNRAPANAWSLAALEDLEEKLGTVENDRNVRAVILTGSGEKCFSAGFDVKDAANQATTGPKGQEMWTRIDRFEKPVIAALNGHAFGGGLELALCCHFRIMADSTKAQIGLTELNLGIIPGWGGTQRLMREVGRAKALDMILFSKRLGPAEALEAGLVHQIVPPEKLMDEVTNFAQKLAERPPVAVGCVLRAMTTGIYEGIDQGLKVEREGSKTAGASKDAQEGFTAFLEKRKPVFKGE